jgi:hypothetical protein
VTLLARVEAATTCTVEGCERKRALDAEVCDVDLNELWALRLDRQENGTYTRRRTFRARDETGAIASHAA